MRRSRDKRAKRFVYALAVSLLVAGGAGLYLGFQSHQTRDEVRSLQSGGPASELEALGEELSTEVNRTLLELWRMEDVEYMRNR